MTDTAEAPITRNDFSKVDQAALDKAIELTLAEDDDDGRTKQLRDMLVESGWWHAASFAAYHCQFEHLSLAPWEATPSSLDPDQLDAIIARGPLNNFEFGAAKLLKKMLAAGVSRFDPAPIDALAAAKRR